MNRIEMNMTNYLGRHMTSVVRLTFNKKGKT